ncbi:MAG: hypothetical protein KatS3mg029_0290 [Saprospiraceae bacterium]|nr:MAG: hypothetical protein KatS3mg029_0290 [Saprospiraceae bacterium]
MPGHRLTLSRVLSGCFPKFQRLFVRFNSNRNILRTHRKYPMKYTKLLFFFVAMAFQANAQTLFSLTPQTVTAEKPANFFTMYSYATFENLSGTDLNMRWVKTLATPQPLFGHGIEWGEWSITLQDPSNWHNPATHLDSADFVLPAIPDESTNKFIMQFYPANEPGHLVVKYKVFVIDNPSESVDVTFDYTASMVSATEGEKGAVSEKIRTESQPCRHPGHRS